MECCSKTFVEDIERKDLLRFAVFLRDEKELAPRTVHNKFAEVLTFLDAQGVPKLLGKNDRPRFVEQEVEIYGRRSTVNATFGLFALSQHPIRLLPDERIS
jgi:hypothetical protein